ncbi:tetratricopeptide repeat protein 36 -like [Asbolus verrucosus]|uniref:Tetratricopeptide repeat protein 36-like n=1 Tax=Asbolus verrucosus TaxID=1661398 RepID=A0A482VL00_ASBVE|nr:tetratricopeptide repeat protein 36 -like [Asbolus verrucosus]
MAELSEHDKAILNCVFNPNLPLSETTIEEPESLEVDVEENTAEVEETKKLEIEAIKLAETGKLDEALALLNRALEIAPNRASIYNNRAHVYQFQRKFTEAFDDLTKAIELARDLQKKTLSQAHCQRGLLHRRASRLESAREDFEIAAQLGNRFAKSQLVELNPYAALCNQMLRKVMDSL